ncbi:hypothetical protein BYT27DRAFT_7216952 [Phlegmacium glaucopus]|nr:hypothetical protein BYT27DRAFT_7216952 [Phlegmacium glaucopus]
MCDTTHLLVTVTLVRPVSATITTSRRGCHQRRPQMAHSAICGRQNDSGDMATSPLNGNVTAQYQHRQRRPRMVLCAICGRRKEFHPVLETQLAVKSRRHYLRYILETSTKKVIGDFNVLGQGY